MARNGGRGEQPLGPDRLASQASRPIARWRRVDRNHPAGRLSLRRRDRSLPGDAEASGSFGSRYSLARGVAVREPERRSGAGLFRRRSCRRHHHCAQPIQILRGDRPQFFVCLQGPRRRRAAGRQRARGRVRARRKCAACRRPIAHRRPTGRTVRPAHIFGHRISMVRSTTCSNFRTGFPRASRPLWSRISRRRRSSGRGGNGREASPLTTSICGRYQSSRRNSAKENADAYGLLAEALTLEPENAIILGNAARALVHPNLMGWTPIGPDDKETCAAFGAPCAPECGGRRDRDGVLRRCAGPLHQGL